jgi:hypothetical protein
MENKKQLEEMTLKNVSVKWAKVHEPGKAYEDTAPKEWSINCYVNDEDRDALMARGCNPKEDKDGNEFFVAKRSTLTKAGAQTTPPIVVDAKKAVFTDEVGNGSVCNVAVTLIPWTKNKRSGVKLYLRGVQVLTHVPHNKGGADVFDAVPVDGDVF